MKRELILTILIVMLLLGMAAGPVAAATTAEIKASIDKGLDWLVSTQNADGSWGPGGGDQLGTTGLILVKLEDRAFEMKYNGPFDPAYPYKANVEKGLDFFLAQATNQPIYDQAAGNPDTNGNGLGIGVGSSTYNTGILMMAIAAGRDPNRVVNSGPLAGMTYKQVLQDLTDWMAYGQTDNGNHRGGWYYGPQNNGGSADMSNAGYALLGLMYAKDPVYGFNCNIAPFVETNLNNYIDYIQSDWGDGVNSDLDGGAGYTAPDYWVNSLKTGSLLTFMAFVGDDSSDVRVQEALKYIGRHWTENWVQGWGMTGSVEYQSTYCLMKGFMAMETPMNGVPGVANWYQDFADNIIAEQQASGSWPSSPAYVWYYGTPSHYVSEQLSTVWALLTLEKFAPEKPIPNFGIVKSASDYTIQKGDSVTYTFKVVNTGAVPMQNIAVTDDKLGPIAGPDSGDTNGNSILDPGETWVYTKATNLFVTTTNIGSVTGADPQGVVEDRTSKPVTVTVEDQCPGGICAPEFPTFTLPVGMILGFMFIVYTMKMTRKD